MGLINFLKHLTYRPTLIRLARLFGLQAIGRKLYWRWARPKDGILRFTVGSVSGQFYVRTPEELRMLGKAESGHWEQDCLEFLIRKLHTGDVVYDIGSSVGLYTVFLAKAVGESGQVISFEPECHSYDRLSDNLRLNGLTNVHIFQVALGDYSGEERLYFSSDDLLFSNLIRPRTRNVTYQLVRIMEGDRFREAENLSLPLAVKIDVEGYEYAVIRGLKHTLSDPACKLVLCEVHPTLLPPEVKPEQVLELLKSLGFSRIDIHRWSWIPEYHVLAQKEIVQ